MKDEASVEAAVEKTVARFGGIEIAVHAAGIGGETPGTDHASLENWQKVIDINQTGVWLCQRAVVRQMQKQEYCLPCISRLMFLSLEIIGWCLTSIGTAEGE